MPSTEEDTADKIVLMPSTEEDTADKIVLTSSTEENDSRVRIMIVHSAIMTVELA